MENWDDLRVLLAVVRTGSFTAAARVLGVNQSTVSRRIAELEAGLGRELVHRSARSFTPTELARRLVGQAETIETAVAEFDRLASEPDAPVGTVRLATTEELTSGLLVPAFPALRRSYPDLRLAIIGAGQIVDLERGEADVALRALRPTRGELVSRCVARLNYGAYASRGYLRRHRGRAPEELDWLALDDPHSRLPETRWIDELTSGRDPVLRSNNTLDLALAAANGVGVALLPDLLAARHPTLVPVDPRAAPLLERRLWLVTHRSLVQVARVRAVMDWVAQTCEHMGRRTTRRTGRR